jgi:N6-L-threonylcarbamoyladenine synthase
MASTKMPSVHKTIRTVFLIILGFKNYVQGNFHTMMDALILGIESSCDETSAAVLKGQLVLSNIIADQGFIHRYYGGVVPELASRAHQQKIIPVVEEALLRANITKNEIQAVAFTRGPGLMGALLVGTSFAKAFALGLDVPLIDVNHMQGHVLAHFIQKKGEELKTPAFPFLCLIVSGGHTQIVLVKEHLSMEIIGQTRDDAAGEAFDKSAKILGLPYPGGPLIDKYAREGNPKKYHFPIPQIDALDFSFSGLKTAILYFIMDEIAKDKDFIQNNIFDVCASIQETIVTILMQKLLKAIDQTRIKEIAIAGGVSANSSLRKAVLSLAESRGCNVYIPPFEFCTDNAAMIAMAGYYKLLNGITSEQSVVPVARM